MCIRDSANGVLYTRILGRDPAIEISSLRNGSSGRGIQESFTEAIIMSFRSLGIVLAYIVMFMFITDLLHMCGGFSLVESQSVRALVKGFFEMTVGCGAVAECGSMTESMKCILSAAIMSWGGLSVLGQSMSCLLYTSRCV